MELVSVSVVFNLFQPEEWETKWKAETFIIYEYCFPLCQRNAFLSIWEDKSRAERQRGF